MKKSLRTVLALVAVAVVLLAQTGCATINSVVEGDSIGDIFGAMSTDITGEPAQDCKEISVALPRHPGYDVIIDKTAYATLTSASMQEAYQSIEASLFLVSDEWSEEFSGYKMQYAKIPTLNSAEIFIVKEAVLADHPEAFWITGDYSIGANMHDGSYVTLYSGYSYNEIVTRVLSLERSLIAIFKEIPSNRTEYERELAIHDILVRNISYDVNSVAAADNYIDAATAYGALVNDRAICTGYSQAFKLLCNRLGLSCRTVKGISKGEAHMWNMVCISGYWYHVDITWDDPIVSGSDLGTLSYDYLNLNDSMITVDHKIADTYAELERLLAENPDYNQNAFYNFELPVCTATRYNFYAQNAVRISDLSEQSKDRIIELMQEARLSGQEFLYLQFAENMDYHVVSAWLNDILLEGIYAANNMANAEECPEILHCERYIRSTDYATPWLNVHTVKVVYADISSDM